MFEISNVYYNTFRSYGDYNFLVGDKDSIPLFYINYSKHLFFTLILTLIEEICKMKIMQKLCKNYSKTMQK